MEDICGRIAHWAQERRWDAMAAPSRERIRNLFIDTLGCAFAGRPHPAVAQSTTVARALWNGHEATGLGSGQTFGLLGAMLDSGAAIRALDLNDFYWGPGLGGHPSDIFATALAVAESRDLSLADMLAAVATGYEFYTRLMDLMRAGDPPWPWDHTSACAPCATLIAAQLLKPTQEQLAQALAISLARAPVFSALRAGKISSVKAAAPALGQADGVIALQLSMAGMTGPRGAVDGPRGLEAIIVEGSSLDHLLPGEGETERVMDITVKRFPCMGTGQAATAVAVALHEQLGPRIADIEAITLQVSNSGIVRRQTADVYRRPDRRETADHSFYAIFGIALVDGKLSPDQFAARRWESPEVARVIDSLTLIPDLPGEAEGIFPARGHARMRDGTVVTIDMPYAPGHRLNALSDAQFDAKFHAFSEPVIGERRASEILRLCRSPVEQIRVRDILRACAEPN